jgi:hypothetical protein
MIRGVSRGTDDSRSRESLPIVNVVEFWRERVKEVESASAVATGT